MTRSAPRPAVAVCAAVAATAVVLAAGGVRDVPSAQAQSAPPATASAGSGGAGAGDAGAGAGIWKQDCAICHGARGEGSFQGPPVRDSGTAAVDFMVRTGRMPLPFARQRDQLVPSGPANDVGRGPSAYTDTQIRDLVAFTADFVTGPTVPSPPDLGRADVARGGELYRLNCAACHQMAGSGGALAYGTVGPALEDSSPTDVVEAMRTGPGSMPVFPPAVLDADQTRDIAAYVAYLQDPVDRGGASLWHIGPVGEGFVAWVVGIGGAVLLCRWLGERQRVSTRG